MKVVAPRCHHFHIAGFVWNFQSAFRQIKGYRKCVCGNKNGDTEVSPFLTVRSNWNYPARFVTCKSTEVMYFGKPWD